MPVEEVAPSDRATVRRAARLEREVLAREPRFVPEPDRRAIRRLGGESLLLAEAESRLLVGWDEASRLVSRALVSIQPLWQQAHDAHGTGFLSDLVVTPGAEHVALEVVRHAESWLAARGMLRVWAPQSHYLAQFVLRTGAHDEDPTTPLRWDAPEVDEVLRNAGYTPTRPAWTYRIDLRGHGWRERAERVLEHPKCRVRPLEKRRWEQELTTAAAIINRGFGASWPFQPASGEVLLEVFAPLKRVASPWHSLFAEVDGQVAGVCFTMPSYSLPLRRADGGSGPIATIRFLLAARKPRVAAIWLLAVLPEFRGRRIARTLFATALTNYARAGFHTADYITVDDESQASRAIAEGFGGHGRVLHHGYERRLESG